MTADQGLVVWCWGCNKLVQVPHTSDNQPAKLFKCGWCGGVNDLQQAYPLSTLQVQDPRSNGQQCPAPTWEHWQAQQQMSHDQTSSGLPSQQHAVNLHPMQQHQWQQEQQWQPRLWGAHQGLMPSPATSPHSSSAGSSTGRGRCSWRSCWAAAVRACGWLMVLVVLLLICSIAGCGVVMLLPLLCTTWATYLPNASLAALLIFQISFNYAACVLRPAGRVSHHVVMPPKGPDGSVPPGSLQHWSWCRVCRAAKPPSAHHCRTCRACVVNMDHHCPFINNCVGEGNLRSFLLFLLWALLASGYVVFMCSLLVSRNWQVVVDSVMRGYSSSQHSAQHSAMQGPQELVVLRGTGVVDARPAVDGAAAHGDAGSKHTANSSAITSSSSSSSSSSGGGGGGREGGQEENGSGSWASQLEDSWLVASSGLLILVLQGSPWWLLTAYYLVAVSVGVLLAVGLLLGSQLYYLGLGVSYIDYLKGVSSAEVQQPQASHMQVPLRQPGCCTKWGLRVQVTWSRWWELLGVAPHDIGVGSMLRAVLMPYWQLPAATAGKKWR